MISSRAGAFCTAALLWLPLSGCLTYNGNRAIVPFFEIYDQPARPAGPGKALKSGPQEPPAPSREHVFRPFGSFEAIGEERSRLKLLWPFGDFAWGGGEERHWVLPIFYYRNRLLAPAEGSDLDWMVFPFFYGGSDPTEGSYFAFFPFGGKLRGLLAKDETHFILFPFYWRWWEKEYDSMHVLFPFFNRVRGGGHEGWRLWPFYGWYKSFKEDGAPRYEKSFIAWPFYIHDLRDMNSQRPVEIFYSFPFYGQSINPHTVTRSYFFMLFNTARDVKTGDALYFGYFLPYRFTGGQFDPWPLFGWKSRTLNTGGEFVSWDNRGIYPPGGEVLLGEKPAPAELRTRFRQFVLWPLQRYDTDQADGWEETRFWLLPLLWHFHILQKDSFQVTSEWTIWPLYRYRREGGRSTFYFPSPIWFRQENPFERQYARLWRLFLYENNPERRGWELLYGLFSRRFEKAENKSILAVFYGLLEWESSPEGQRFRVFYLPWR
ncbi:MAG: hypothetical protein HY717_06535 [Planctomycetes bacterium]|nr:hypothetical protein [Planctomycetota bacterium]